MRAGEKEGATLSRFYLESATRLKLKLPLIRGGERWKRVGLVGS
jgi:hypothetical protein